MLTKIIIDNINSIGHCEVSFLKSKYQYLDEMIYNDTIVNPIAIYGANGSGKSSFIRAVYCFISKLIREPDSISEFFPNLFKLAAPIINGDKGMDDINREYVSSVEMHFTLVEDNYEYIIETNEQLIISSEILKVNGTVIIKRDANIYSYNNQAYEVKSQSFPVLRSIVKDELTDTFVKKAYDFLSNIAIVDAGKRYYLHKALEEKRSTDLLVEKSKEVNELLKQYRVMPNYDIVRKNNPNRTDDGKKNLYAFNLEFDESKKMELPIGLMSTGMYNNSMMLSLLLSLPKNGVLFIDEIECALHPLTIIDFISVVREKNIQLIFTSHNTFLLQQLRPDQIFFANWKKGYSNYKKLSDIYPNIRQVNNIEKMYLGNMFEEEIKKWENLFFWL